MPPEAAYDLPDFLRSKIHGTKVDSALVELHELTPASGDPIRLVSLVYPQLTGASAPDRVPWDGEEFRAAHVQRDPIPDNSDGRRGQWTATLADDKGEGAALVREHGGLDGATVKIWTTTLEGIELVNRGDATVADVSYAEEYFVVEVALSATPRVISVTLGYPKLQGKRYPAKKYETDHCLNEYHQRHDHDSEPLCNYPSNEFGPSTGQNYVAGATPWAKARRFGWSTEQSTQADEFLAGYETSHVLIPGGYSLRVHTAQKWIQIFDDNRFAPYLFRVIEGDFDVETVVWTDALENDRAGWFGGILIQDEADFSPAPGTPGTTEEDDTSADDTEGPESSWFLWATCDDNVGGSRLKLRETESNVSTDDHTVSDHRHLRVKREGSTIECYSKSLLSSSWTLRETVSAGLSAALPSAVRIGVVAGADQLDQGDKVALEFGFLRFDAGGLATCGKSPDDCDLHQMRHRANFFRRLAR